MDLRNFASVSSFHYIMRNVIGIIIGIILSSESTPVVRGVFFSITVGTFLYIAASEVIVEEFALSKHKYPKFFAFLSGVALIAVLIIYDP